MNKLFRGISLALYLLLVLEGLIYLQQLWLPNMPPLISCFLVLMLAKLLGDVLYYLAWPQYRDWLYLDDYLLNNASMTLAYAVPIAVIQAALGSALYRVGTIWGWLLTHSVPAIAVYLLIRLRFESTDHIHKPGKRVRLKKAELQKTQAEDA